MAQLIDAGNAINRLDRLYNPLRQYVTCQSKDFIRGYSVGVADAVMEIALTNCEQPTAVVHCSDCVHGSPDGNGYRCEQVPCLSWKADDFCSKGRRHDEAT